MHEKIIVFDGVCHLCSGWVRFLLVHDRAQQYRFAAMQGATGRRLLAAQGLDINNPISFLLFDGTNGYTDSEAILRVLVSLGGFWRAIVIVYSVDAKSVLPLPRNSLIAFCTNMPYYFLFSMHGMQSMFSQRTDNHTSPGQDPYDHGTAGQIEQR